MKPSTLALIALAFGATTQRAVAAPACYTELLETSRFEPGSVVICAADALRQDVRVLWTDPSGAPLRNFDNLAKALGPDANRVRFAMNAGMFDEQSAPIGLYVEDGAVRIPLNTRSGNGNFYLKPNGVFWVGKNGTLGIDTTEQYAKRSHTTQWATQSGPMLIVDGKINPQIAPDGPSRFIRNVVCVRDPHTAVFAISEEPISFGRMARFLRDNLGCRNALYLDGAISSLWSPSIARKDGAHPLGPIVVVLDR